MSINLNTFINKISDTAVQVGSFIKDAAVELKKKVEPKINTVVIPTFDSLIRAVHAKKTLNAVQFTINDAIKTSTPYFNKAIKVADHYFNKAMDKADHLQKDIAKTVTPYIETAAQKANFYKEDVIKTITRCSKETLVKAEAFKKELIEKATPMIERGIKAATPYFNHLMEALKRVFKSLTANLPRI